MLHRNKVRSSSLAFPTVRRAELLSYFLLVQSPPCPTTLRFRKQDHVVAQNVFHTWLELIIIEASCRLGCSRSLSSYPPSLPLCFTINPAHTIPAYLTESYTMNPNIDLEVGQVPHATPSVRAFFSLSHHFFFPFG
jgi:hypothetical protein